MFSSYNSSDFSLPEIETVSDPDSIIRSAFSFLHVITVYCDDYGTFVSWFDLRDAYHLDPFGFYAGSNKISAPLLFPIIFNVLQPCTRAASRPRGQRVLAALRPCRGLAAPRLCRLAPSRALAAQHPRFAAPRPRRPTRAPRPSHPRRPAPSGSPRRASLRRRDDCEATAL
jgi:hypothetical protein